MAEKVKFIELKQKHVEAYLEQIPKDISAMRVPTYNRHVVRAALLAGWFDPPLELDPEGLGELTPGKVRKLAETVQAEYARVMDISPE